MLYLVPTPGTHHFLIMYWVSIVSDSMSTTFGLSTIEAVSSFLTLSRTEHIWDLTINI